MPESQYRPWELADCESVEGIYDSGATKLHPTALEKCCESVVYRVVLIRGDHAALRKVGLCSEHFIAASLYFCKKDVQQEKACSYLTKGCARNLDIQRFELTNIARPDPAVENTRGSGSASGLRTQFLSQEVEGAHEHGSCTPNE